MHMNVTTDNYPGRYNIAICIGIEVAIQSPLSTKMHINDNKILFSTFQNDKDDKS